MTLLLKECRDVQLRCGAARDDDDEDYPLLSDVEMDMESEADKIISEHLVSLFLYFSIMFVLEFTL